LVESSLANDLSNGLMPNIWWNLV